MSFPTSRTAMIMTGAVAVAASSVAVCVPAIASNAAVDAPSAGPLPMLCTLNADGLPQLDTPGCAVKANPGMGKFVTVLTPGTITQISNDSPAAGSAETITVSDGTALTPVTLAPGQSKTINLKVDQNTVLTVTGSAPGQVGYLNFKLHA